MTIVLVSIKEFSVYKLNQKKTLLANLLEGAKNVSLLEKVTKDLYVLEAQGSIQQAHVYCDKIYAQLRENYSKQQKNQIQKRVHVQQKRLNEIRSQESQNHEKADDVLKNIPSSSAKMLTSENSESLLSKIFKILFLIGISVIAIVQSAYRRAPQRYRYIKALINSQI